MKNHAATLLSLIKSHGFNTMIEIGIGKGNGAKIILEGTKKPYEFLYYGIDPYEPYPRYNNDINSRPGRITRNKIQAEKNLAPYVLDHRACIFECTSKVAAIKFMKNVVNLVFIDGNHSYEYVKQDIDLYWRAVKNWGIMAVHDYNHVNFPGVKRAVDEFVKENNLELLNKGDVWYFYKVK